MNGFTKVCRDGRFSDCRPQNLSRLLFRGAMVLGGAHTQARFHLVIKIADRNACHVLALEIDPASSYMLIATQSCARVNGITLSLD